MSCWFCKHTYTNRCIHGTAFGTQQLSGGQAEYVRVPFADGTLKVLTDNIEDDFAIMMCDILPTGYYGASRALSHFKTHKSVGERDGQDCGANLQPQIQSVSEAVFVV